MATSSRTQPIDHDRLFKELIQTFFLEFCWLFLQPVAEALDPSSLEFLDKEIFSDVTFGARHEADLVVKAKWRDEATCFIIHVETQAQHQPSFNKRMFRYFARLHEKLDLPIYPVVLFSFGTPRQAQPDNYTVSFPHLEVLRFQYQVIQLNQLSWRDFVNNPNPVASALMAKMRIAPRDRPHVKLECLRLLATLKLDPARMQLISGMIDTYLQLNVHEEREFQIELATVAPEQKEPMVEIVTSWMKQGIKQGMEQGIKQGMEQGRSQGVEQGRSQGVAEIVGRQLRRRFRTLPSRVQSQINALPFEDLKVLADALLDFKSKGDVQAWLEQRRH